MTAHRLLVGLVSLVLGSCSMMPPPVPISGSPSQVSVLGGSWNGEYHSRATGRHGSIHFTLAAGRDTAFGDVLMLPRKTMQSPVVREGNRIESPRPESRTLNITFVHAARDSVYGLLDPYEDPECGCTLVTWFAGRISGDSIEGRYTSRNEKTGELTVGEWSVRRDRRKPARAALGS